MTNIDKDVENTCLIISHFPCSGYDNVYFHSNENLKVVFSEIDVLNKDVLSVLASGDQAFHLLNKGAKHVDLFDKNKLTIYYYYIRLWTLKYLGNFYPNSDFTISFVAELLKFVNPSSKEENDAYNYWTKIVNSFDNNMINKLFYRGSYERLNEIKDINQLLTRIDEKFSFYNIDLRKDVSEIKNKYDVIYISNISEYVFHDEPTFEKYMNNIYNLLKPNGVVISVNARYKLFLDEEDYEKKIFSKKFDGVELPCVERYDFVIPSGKMYIKK